jgi:hypothetical protein
LEKCFEILSERIANIEDAIQHTEASMTEETKSSAGDKYETSREMIQQDLGRLETQLQLARNDNNILRRVEAQKQLSKVIGLGSLLHMDDGMYYFIATGIGRIQFDKSICYVISLASPLGKLLHGKTVGDNIEINGSRKKIVAMLI